MNFKALPELTATGQDQPVEVPRGALLLVRCAIADVEVRHSAGSNDKLTVPSGTLLPLGPSLGQTIYLRAGAGAVIQLALT